MGLSSITLDPMWRERMDKKKREDVVMAFVCDFCSEGEGGCDIRDGADAYCDEVLEVARGIIDFLGRGNEQG